MSAYRINAYREPAPVPPQKPRRRLPAGAVGVALLWLGALVPGCVAGADALVRWWGTP